MLSNSKMLKIIVLILLLILFKKRKEHFSWSCNWTPNKDYYKEKWLLGGNDAALAMARDSIQGPFYN